MYARLLSDRTYLVVKYCFRLLSHWIFLVTYSDVHTASP